MGVFDLPAPAFAWLDTQAALLLPAPIRLVFWGVLGAGMSMGLYRIVSPQERIANGKRALAEARRRLDHHDGEFADALPLIGELLRTALHQVGRVGRPAILASLPLLCLLAWLSTAYGYGYPAPGTTPDIQTAPLQLDAEWVQGPAPAPALPPRIVVTDPQHQVIVADVPLSSPVPIIHKRRWWNALLGNPAGYLPEDAPVDRIRVNLPHREYLEVGPEWVRGWEFTFFLTLVAVSIALKVVARIE